MLQELSRYPTRTACSARATAIRRRNREAILSALVESVVNYIIGRPRGRRLDALPLTASPPEFVAPPSGLKLVPEQSLR